MRYLALLRGVNVGGKNILRMPDLRCVLEGLGCTRVTTYIQSGNVVFDSRLKNPVKLSAAIEESLASQVACPARVVVVGEDRLAAVVNNAPPEFGALPAQFRYDVVFLKPHLDARALLPTISLKPGVDEAFAANGVLYLRRLTFRATQSRLPQLTRHAAYPGMTIRNWNTTTKLHRLIGMTEPP